MSQPPGLAALTSVGWSGGGAVPLHGSPPTVLPHWAVLLAVVPAGWLLVAGAVLAAERALDRLGG